MTTSVNLELDTRSTKKNGTHPLKLLFVVGRNPFRVALGHSILSKDWNPKTQTVKSSCKLVVNVTRLNSLLQKKKAAALSILNKLEETGELFQLTTKEIKNKIVGKQANENNVLAFFGVVITEMEVAGKVGNARVYRMVKGSISNFLNGKDIPLTKITYKWLEKYEIWFLNRGNKLNGLSFNLRTLRALLNKAIKRKILSKDAYPFNSYTIRNQKTKKRAIKKSAVEAIIEYQPKSAKEERAIDYFLASFYLMGMSFVDLAFLTLNNIKNVRVEYKRKKTGKLHSIKIIEPLQKIFDKYTRDKSGDDFILNIIKHKIDKKSYKDITTKDQVVRYHIINEDRPYFIPINAELNEHIQQYPSGKKRDAFLLNLVANDQKKEQYKNIRNELRLYNNCMNKIGKALGIDHKITSYVARHSFATIAKHKGVPIPVISQALGHTDMKTTEVYLAEFDNDVMDHYNLQIIGD